MTNPAELKNYIRSEDLTGDLALVSELCGEETAKLLAVKLSGMSLYISEKVLKPGRIRLARELKSQGMSVKRIAVLTGISERLLFKKLSSSDSKDQMEFEDF